MLPMTCPGCRGMDFRITFAGEQIIPPEGPAVLTCSGCGNVFWGRLSIVGGCRRDGYPGEEDAA